MKSTAACLAALALAVGVAADAHGQAKAPQQSGRKVYRWVDDKGQVHFGDRVPPEYAQQDADVLNRQGVPVRRIEGNETPEEARLREQQELALKRAAQQRQRDRVLLQTYLSVQEIERLRDSRLEVIDGQILIQQQYLAQLGQKHDRQLRQASNFKPYSKDPAAADAPEGLLADIARSEADLSTQEGNLQKKRAERESLKTRFEADMARFKELKGMKAGVIAPRPGMAATPATAPAATRPATPPR